MLLHIQQAQLIPTAVLAELIYILAYVNCCINHKSPLIRESLPQITSQTSNSTSTFRAFHYYFPVILDSYRAKPHRSVDLAYWTREEEGCSYKLYPHGTQTE